MGRIRTQAPALRWPIPGRSAEIEHHLYAGQSVSGSSPNPRKRYGPSSSRNYFRPYELINIADEVSWFPPKRITWGKRTTLAGFAHELRKLRNYVHLRVWAPEQPETMRFTKRVYGVAYEIFDVANSWLLHRMQESLRKCMRREGLP